MIFLADLYSKKTLIAILEYAIAGQCDIYFLNQLTHVPQPLTVVQLTGIKQFQGVMIYLETGQTYQIGLEMTPKKGATYQEVFFADLIVNQVTLAQIQATFGDGNKNL